MTRREGGSGLVDTSLPMLVSFTQRLGTGIRCSCIAGKCGGVSTVGMLGEDSYFAMDRWPAAIRPPRVFAASSSTSWRSIRSVVTSGGTAQSGLEHQTRCVKQATNEEPPPVRLASATAPEPTGLCQLTAAESPR